MAEKATRQTTIAAPVERCYEVVADFERYPEWAADVKDVDVARRDDQGRGIEVAFRTAAMGRSTNYVLLYDHGAAPGALSWRLLSGDIMTCLDGSYTFEAAEGDPESTDVTYHLTIELLLPLPGFVKRRAEARIIKTALRELKAHLEGS